MSYKPVSQTTKKFYLAHSCPYLFQDRHCAGGDYCPYPPGKEKLCCFFCPRFDTCPDKTGVCVRFKEKL